MICANVLSSFLDVGVGRRKLDRLGFIICPGVGFGRAGVVVLYDVDGPHRAEKCAALPRACGDGHGWYVAAQSGVGTLIVAVRAECACFEARLATLEGRAAGGCAIRDEEGLGLVEGGRVGFAHLGVGWTVALVAHEEVDRVVLGCVLEAAATPEEEGDEEDDEDKGYTANSAACVGCR